MALMMVLVMAMTVLVLPASAATVEDTISPQASVIPCSSCGEKTATYTRTVSGAKEYQYVVAYQCTYNDEGHNHVRTVTYQVYSCPCGATTKRYTSTTAYYCPYVSGVVNNFADLTK